jgi:hypothetical protein
MSEGFTLQTVFWIGGGKFVEEMDLRLDDPELELELDADRGSDQDLVDLENEPE